MFGLVIFDLDGTLVDTAGEITAAVNAALAEARLHSVDETQVRRWIGHGTRELMQRAYAHAAGNDPGGVPGSPGFESALRAFEWHYAAHSGRHSRPFPDAVQSLFRLRELGVATALVTNKEARFTAPVLHAHGLWACLDAVVCGDTLEHKKPHPAPVEHCLARFRTLPERALVVGDSEIDIATARNAGVAVWAVPYGYNHGKPIGEARPDRVIATVRAVVDAVEQAVSA